MYNSTQTEEEFLAANKAGILQRVVAQLHSFARRYLMGPAGLMGPMGMRVEPGLRAPLTAYVADEERVPKSVTVWARAYTPISSLNLRLELKR